MRTCSRALIAGLILIAGGCGSSPKEFELGGFRYHIDGFEQWKLPKSLREISGLTATVEGRVFAHADERGVIHELDYHGGRLVKSFALTRPNGKILKGDFEGIAAVGDHLYLLTSDGRLFRFKPGMDGGKVPFEALPTDSGDYCELEGLTYDPRHHALLLACKRVYDRTDASLQILFFSLRTDLPDPARNIRIDGEIIARKLGTSEPLNPSGIAISPRSGSLLLVAARQRTVLEAGTDGTLINVFRWPMERYHRQTEGIIQLTSGTLLVADEGHNKRGRLGVYRATN